MKKWKWTSVNNALPDNDRTVEAIVKNWGGGRITYEHTFDSLVYNDVKGIREWLYGDGRCVDTILWKEADRYSNRNI